MGAEELARVKVFQLIKEFHKKQSNDWCNYGAGDTEPRWHFTNALRGNEIPETARDWEIFYDMKGADSIATEMTHHLKRILKEAAVTPVPIRRSVFAYFGII